MSLTDPHVDLNPFSAFISRSTKGFLKMLTSLFLTIVIFEEPKHENHVPYLKSFE